MLSGRQVQARLAIVALIGAGVVGAIFATRAWDDSAPLAFLLLSILALVSILTAVFLVLPGLWKLRAIVVCQIAVVVVGLLGLGCVIAPKIEVSAAYDGDNVAWSRLVPKDQRSGADRDNVRFLTALSAERVVVTSSRHVLVIDPRDGHTVRSFSSTVSSRTDPIVARTIDGFVLKGDDQFQFYDADGKPLGLARGEQLVARTPGTSVVLDCSTGDCVAIAFDDAGKERWRSARYGRTFTVRIADDKPADSLPAVIPSAVLLALDDAASASEPNSFDLLDAENGKVARTFRATYAGSTLGRDGRSMTFAVQPDNAKAGRCTVVIWDGADTRRTESEKCEKPVAVTGDHLVFNGANSTWIVDLSHPTRSLQLSPPAADGANRSPIRTDTGIGGTALLRIRFDGTYARWASRAVTGGEWGVKFSKWWTYETPGDVTAAYVGEASVHVTSAVVRLNPWDRPGKDDSEITVMDISSGERTGHIRVDKRLDSSVGLPDGSVLIALEGGRLIRLGESAN